MTTADNFTAKAILCYCGTPVEKLSLPDLIDAVHELHARSVQRDEMFRKVLRCCTGTTTLAEIERKALCEGKQ
jgi:hypothetical protein